MIKENIMMKRNIIKVQDHDLNKEKNTNLKKSISLVDILVKKNKNKIKEVIKTKKKKEQIIIKINKMVTILIKSILIQKIVQKMQDTTNIN